MKKKILKIMGVGLTLMLVFSLGAIFAPSPVLADEDEWSAVDFPDVGEDGDWVYTDTIDAGPAHLDIAINGDLWVYAEVPADEHHIFVSDDGGRTWTQTEFDDETVEAGNAGTDVSAIACSSIDEDIVYVAAEDTADWWVWKTDDGGDSWAQVNAAGMPDIFDAAPDNENMTALDVAYNSDDNPYVFWGTTDPDDSTGHVYYINEEGFGAGWTNLELDGAADGDLEVFGLGCSPDFEHDGITVVLTADADETFICTNYGVESEWDELELLDEDDVEFNVTEGSDPVFPADFDEDDAYEFFVSVVTDDDIDNYVYLVYGVLAGEFLPLDDVDQDIISLAGVGTQGSMYLIAGENENEDDYATVWYSHDDGDSWDEADKGPNGTAAYVVMDEDFEDDTGLAWVATTEDPDPDFQVGGVYGTVDAGVLWNGLSLFDYTIDSFAAEYDYAMAVTADSPTTIFLITWDGTIDLLWRTSDDGDTWDIVLQSTLMDIEADDFDDLVAISPESSDVIYVGDTSEACLMRSIDGGNDWAAARNEPDAPLDCWVIIDDETILAGGNGEVWFTDRHGARAWDDYEVAGAADIFSFALSPAFDADETILCGDEEGEVYISEDYGETWDMVGDAVDDADVAYVAFDPGFANSASDGYNLIYAAAADTVARFLDVTELTDDWDPYDAGVPPGGHGVGNNDDTNSNMVVATDGTLYVCDWDAADADDGGLARTVNPLEDLDDVDETEWNVVSTDMGLVDDSKLEGLVITYGSDSNILWSWEDDLMVMYTYEDTLSGPVTLRSPADGADSGRVDTCDVAWEGMDNATEYFIQWDISAEMDYNPDDEPDQETAYYTIGGVAAEALDGGTLYYWWVRVEDPVFSRFSEVRSFLTRVGGGEWNPFVTAEMVPGNVAPVPGASDVPLQPGFQWNAADWAEEYEFTLADNPGFISPIESKTVTTPFAAIDAPLDYSTAYYWKVQGVSADGATSEWGQGTFTTMAEPVEAPAPAAPAAPPIIELPPAPAQIAPQWIYAVIGIGATLAVVVIVLIVRTRKQ